MNASCFAVFLAGMLVVTDAAAAALPRSTPEAQWVDSAAVLSFIDAVDKDIDSLGYGLSIRTEDDASFGQLYLQNGRWQGKQLVPEAWIDEATARQTSNGSNPNSDWDQGYGYQFWRCRHGVYRGDGAFGQYCIVLPEQDTVIAITSGLGNMQAVLNLIWEKLLPAFHSDALPAGAALTHGHPLTLPAVRSLVGALLTNEFRPQTPHHC